MVLDIVNSALARLPEKIDSVTDLIANMDLPESKKDLAFELLNEIKHFHLKHQYGEKNYLEVESVPIWILPNEIGLNHFKDGNLTKATNIIKEIINEINSYSKDFQLCLTGYDFNKYPAKIWINIKF